MSEDLDREYPETIEWPEVPDFRAYEHAFPPRATEVKIGMLYSWHYEELVRPLLRHRSSFECERFNIMTGEWESMDDLVDRTHLNKADERVIERLKVGRTQQLQYLEQQREHRRLEQLVHADLGGAPKALATIRSHRVAGLTGNCTAVVTARPCRAPQHELGGGAERRRPGAEARGGVAGAPGHVIAG